MGQKERISNEREKTFPYLVETGYHKTSEETTEYNCIAYAAGDQTRKWGIGPYPPNLYWPPGANPGHGIDDLARAFECLGWERAIGGEVEEGYDKVALYATEDGEWQHAAIQSEDGEWSSKLGDWEDIRHSSAHGVYCEDYGEIWYYMRRLKVSQPREEIATAQSESQPPSLADIAIVANPAGGIEEELQSNNREHNEHEADARETEHR